MGKSHRSSRYVVAAVGVLIAVVVASCVRLLPEANPKAPRSLVLETKPLKLDGLYPSMTGPRHMFRLDYSELDWVVGVRSDVIDAETEAPLGDEFFCHSQLQGPHSHWLVMATGAHEIRFPPGFGVRLAREMKDLEPPYLRELRYMGMLLNNHEPEIDRTARVRTQIDYYKNEDRRDLKPLYKVGLTMNVSDLRLYEPDPNDADADDVASHCAPVAGQPVHWYVPPGRQVTRRVLENIIPVEQGTVHYIGAHLHNHGVYMRLTDLTANEVVWQSDAEYEEGRRQISKISHYSDSEGFEIYRDHVYQIEALYENPLAHDIDAMAMMYVYYHPSEEVENLMLAGVMEK